MKLSIVNGERSEPEKGLVGICIGCGQPMIAKCGPIKIWHWAHKSECECDHWWENETEWHRAWKNNFSSECQEIRHKADNGEWHIADVKTAQGHIIEFQHSFLKSEERQARNKFYGNNLVWVVDGLMRKKDRLQFEIILKNAKQITQNFSLVRLPSVFDECSILKEWSECNGPVFFDFGIELPLWCLLPKSSTSARYVGPFSRQIFVELHNGKLTMNGQNFSELLTVLNDLVFAYENPKQAFVRQTQVQHIQQSVRQRQIMIPQNPTKKQLYYLNRTPRRGRF